MRPSFFWFALMGLVLALFYDREVVLWLADHRVRPLNEFFLFLTNAGLLCGVLFFVVALFRQNLLKQCTVIALAFVLALEASMLMKELFMVPRPFLTWPIDPLMVVSGWSFPSTHATFIFAALPFFNEGRLRRWRWAWVAFAALVALSRVMVGVHYLSDVVAGALLGYGVGEAVYRAERQGFVERVHAHLAGKLEVRRQLAHLVSGLGIVALVHFDLLTPVMLLWILVLGGVVALTSRYVEVPGVAWLLDKLERPEVRRVFPGKGSFFLVFGSLLTLMVFSKPVALAAITIMALGDSVAHLFGRYLGRRPLLYNRKKTIEGVLAGWAMAVLGALYFVPLPAAMVASAVAMFVETLDLKFGVDLDDNVLMPLVAGAVLWVMIL